MIEAENLKKTFHTRTRGQSRLVEAVRGVALTVRRGEIFGFLGPNGAGKTTCQRMLTTLLPIDSGTAAIAGFDVKKKPHEVRKHIGYVSQLGGADLPATGRENLIMAGKLYGMQRGEIEKKVHELSHHFELDELLDRIVRTYSGGQKRRLEIALSIIHEPDILFMDEPTTGLDPQNRANFWAHIRKLKENGMTIFLTTHYLDEADELADRIAIMDYGKIVVEGTPAALKRQISGDVIQMRLKAGGYVVQGLWEELDFVNETREDGETVFLYVNDGAKALPVLFDLLKEKHIELDTISLSEPALDDVFLKQTGRSLRDTGKEESK
ncbi:ATP-binding cassette domain-containing protein [Desulfosporosinus sp. PR]|uniref:ATP-binding cassette domain-containing protein n=1 Tax=Candidatus Desulfosporosinus nitrosoreducens TaxID=3401928 RepID=UPI0027EAD22B|nr:ATP-binding cassette domain-containing protein [Desulfosporosinus sp. PR]MDQ7093710.1 ATP-binding cassette domain-containing protein [Desulfosporosinus sp. PR]